MNQDFINGLASILEKDRILLGEPMERHTTFRIGGPADCMALPENAGEVRRITAYCREKQVPYYIIGNGSNLLVSDAGYRGVIVQICGGMSRIKIEKEHIYAQAGALLSRIASAALDEELTGLEFASGIPGTLGGACVMNAGAYGGEMKDVLERAAVLTPEGEIRELCADEMKLGYRSSIFAEKNYIVLEAVLALKKGERSQIRERMEEFRKRRVEKQPLQYPSAGSTFKRPEGYFAGKLIEDAGLRGFRIGGAQVSEKHCGFVINNKNAAAWEVDELMRRVSDTVWEKFGVRLEPEVKKLGEF